MSDKMNIDKVFRFGENTIYELNYKYDRSSIKKITPITKMEKMSIIDKKYLDGVNIYLKPYINIDEYIHWRKCPNTMIDIYKNRCNYLKRKVEYINRNLID